jgi:hypothetical protein
VALIADCDQRSRVTLTGTLTEVSGSHLRHGKRRTNTFRLGPANRSVNAGRATVLTVKLPKVAQRGLRRKAKASATFTLIATNANGSTRTTAKITALKASR